MAMANEAGWRGVVIPPPDPLAGIGGALRHAYRIDRTSGVSSPFSELVRCLDRVGGSSEDPNEARHH